MAARTPRRRDRPRITCRGPRRLAAAPPRPTATDRARQISRPQPRPRATPRVLQPNNVRCRRSTSLLRPRMRAHRIRLGRVSRSRETPTGRRPRTTCLDRRLPTPTVRLRLSRLPTAATRQARMAAAAAITAAGPAPPLPPTLRIADRIRLRRRIVPADPVRLRPTRRARWPALQRRGTPPRKFRITRLQQPRAIPAGAAVTEAHTIPLPVAVADITLPVVGADRTPPAVADITANLGIPAHNKAAFAGRLLY